MIQAMKDSIAPGSLLEHTRHNSEALSVAMRFWARSMGDRNPRHVVESYRSSSDAAGFVAHPCWLYSVHDTIIQAGHSSLQAIIAGTRWRFARTVVIGDQLQTRARLISEQRKLSRLAGEAIHQRVAVQFFDARGSEVAQAESTLVLVAPEAAQQHGKYKDWKRWRYSEAELIAIENGYDAEQVRGATPLYWDEVRIGDALQSIVRGPVSSEEIVLFVGGTRPLPGGAAFSSALAQGQMQAFQHPSTGAWETYAAGMIDDVSAQQLGYPAAHDYGIDRISQMGSLITNWMGDSGQLLELDARLIEACMHGDTTWFHGRVTSKEPGAGEPETSARWVDIAAEGINQRGEVTVVGTARVSLPCRKA